METLNGYYLYKNIGIVCSSYLSGYIYIGINVIGTIIREGFHKNFKGENQEKALFFILRYE